MGAPADKAVAFLTNSWVASSDPQTVLEDSAGRDSEGRVFFTGTPCLPKDTPPGLVKYREDELATLRVRASPLVTSEPPLPMRERERERSTCLRKHTDKTSPNMDTPPRSPGGSRSTLSMSLPLSEWEQPTRAVSSG